jgi:hypothetical protein
MSHLIICLGKDNNAHVRKIIKKFDNIYIISNDVEEFNPDNIDPKQKISLLMMPKLPLKDLVEALSYELKTQLSKDKITDLDIAVNISSGSGDIHSAIIAAVMKLGYGIRLVDIDDKNTLIEL